MFYEKFSLPKKLIQIKNKKNVQLKNLIFFCDSFYLYIEASEYNY